MAAPTAPVLTGAAALTTLGPTVIVACGPLAEVAAGGTIPVVNGIPPVALAPLNAGTGVATAGFGTALAFSGLSTLRKCQHLHQPFKRGFRGKRKRAKLTHQ
jgi:hypothetical protein